MSRALLELTYVALLAQAACPNPPPSAPAAPAPPAPAPVAHDAAPQVSSVPPASSELGDRPDLAVPLLGSLDAFSKGDLAAALELFAEDVVWEVMGAPIAPIRGREALAAFWREHRRVFPEGRLHPLGVFIVADDAVVLRAIFEGTQRQEYLGLEPPARSGRAEVVYLCRLREGRIATVQSYGDVSRTLRRHLETGEMPACCGTLPSGEPAIERSPPLHSRVPAIETDLEREDGWRTPLGKALRGAASSARFELGQVLETRAHAFVTGVWRGVHDAPLSEIAASFRPFELHVLYAIALPPDAPLRIEVFYDGAELAEALAVDPALVPFFEAASSASKASAPSSDASQ